MKKELVKQNINFLEYPLWFQDDRLAEKSLNGYNWSDNEGYIYRSSYKIPVKTDIIFLFYFLLESQRKNCDNRLTLTRYKVLKGCDRTISKVWYDRLEDSLNRWLRVDISFEGNFYDGNEYHTIAFHIIDSWSLNKKTNKLEITLSPKFLEMMHGKRFFKLIDFNEFKSLISSLATRLYAILSKSFHNRNTWEIDAMKLSQKIPLSLKYPSEVKAKIQPAINRINKHTNLKIEFSERKKERGKSIFIFTKLEVEKKPVIQAKQASFNPLPSEAFADIIKHLPEEKRNQKSVLEIIQQYYKEFGADYVIRNIKYTRGKATKNFRYYLNKALKGDWGIIIEEDKEERVLQAQLRKLKLKHNQQQAKAKEEEITKEKELEEKVKRYINNLSEQEAQELREEALETLEPQVIEYLLSSPKSASGIAARMSLKTRMYKIAQNKLAYR